MDARREHSGRQHSRHETTSDKTPKVGEMRKTPVNTRQTPAFIDARDENRTRTPLTRDRILSPETKPSQPAAAAAVTDAEEARMDVRREHGGEGDDNLRKINDLWPRLPVEVRRMLLWTAEKAAEGES